MGRVFRIALLALVLLMVALVSALTAMRLAIHGRETEVPALVGMLPSEAERAGANVGLQVLVERQYFSPQIAAGRVMSQEPAPGTKVRRGWQVRVAQSLGPMRVSVPDVRGESERTAELNMQRRGLDIASTAEVAVTGIVPGTVAGQTPPPNAGEVAAPMTSLLVAAAPETPAFVMPKFIGTPLGTASRVIMDSGFKLGNITAAPDATAQPGPASFVVAQTPAAGQKVELGAAISFEVK
jgi:beta-lactam-binding protein with PASTA domain